MAQPGNFTPILLYSSSTPTNVPLAANLTNSATGSEIAINIADKNLFFKDSTNAVNTVPIRQSSTSSNGWLSSTDWNTFNNKAPATSGTSILYGNGSGGFSNVTIGTGISFAGGTLSATGSGGTVTSVTGTSPVVSSGGTIPAISLATAYGDTLNPYASKTANYVLAAPNGSAGVPTFRALVAADLPSLSGTYIPYTGASSAIDLNAQTVTNIAHLGINTTSVPTILIRAIGDNNSSSRIAMRGYSSNASSSSIRVTKFRGTFASPQAPLSGDSLGKFELAGYGTTSSDGYPQASYEGVATENWGATARGTKTLFYVTPNTTTTQAVALTIDQDKSATFVSTVTATSFIGSGSSLTGVVTSVTGTSPVVSSGGTTPAISMPAATTSVSGYLTSTDWNTFNNKGSGTVTSVSGTTGRITSTGGATPVIDLASGVATAGTTGSSTLIPVVTIDTYGRVTSITTASNPQGTVTSVTGTAPVVSSGGATPAISMAAATSSVNGYLTSTDWTTFNGKQAALVSGTNIKTVNGTSLLGSGDVGTIGVAYGGTGLTSLTASYIPYGNGTSAFSSSANLNFDGSNLGVGGTSLGTFNKGIYVNAGANAYAGIQFSNNAYTAGAYVSISNADFNIYNGNSTGNLLFFTNNLERARIFASGGVSIGNTTDPGAANLSVNTNLFVGTTAALGSSVCTFMNNSQYAGPQIVVRNNYNTAGKYWKIGQENNNSLAFYIYNASGVGQYMTDGGTSWLPNVSDERLKNKISDISNALEAVNKLKPLSFYYQNQEQSGIPNYGHFAQDVGNAIPDAMLVSPQKDKEFGDIYTYDPNIINVYLVKAVQELSAKFDAYVASHP